MERELATEILRNCGFLLLIIIIGIFMNYLTCAMAVYRISKVEKRKYSWLAFIPIVQDYQLLKVGGGNPIFLSVYLLVFMYFIIPNDNLRMVNSFFIIIYIVNYLLIVFRLFKEYEMTLIWNLIYSAFPATIIYSIYQLYTKFIATTKLIVIYGYEAEESLIKMFQSIGYLNGLILIGFILATISYIKLFYQTYQERY